MEIMYGLEIAGRKAVFDVLVENEGAQPLIGQIVLERLDLVEPSTGRVIPNPRSPETPMIEIFLATSPNSKDTATLRYTKPHQDGLLMSVKCLRGEYQIKILE